MPNYVINFDFKSLYPSTQKVYTNAYLDAMKRKSKINRILKKVNE